MKKLYSYILLLSFFTGAIQPVLPMAEYIFSEEGEIAALFNGSCDTICSMTTEEMDGEECKLCDYPDAEDLLDIEYYPIPLQVTSSSSRSEEHTSELQSRGHLVCRLLLETKRYDQ